jgi:hypothetical protein
LIFGGKQMYVLLFPISLCGFASISVASNSSAVVLFGKKRVWEGGRGNGNSCLPRDLKPKRKETERRWKPGREANVVQTGPTRRPRAIIASKVERRCIWFLRCGVAFRHGHILGDRKGLQERINPEDLGGDVDYGAAYWMDDIRIRG